MIESVYFAPKGPDLRMSVYGEVSWLKNVNDWLYYDVALPLSHLPYTSDARWDSETESSARTLRRCGGYLPPRLCHRGYNL
jgi:hypothetical protein